MTLRNLSSAFQNNYKGIKTKNENKKILQAAAAAGRWTENDLILLGKNHFEKV